jgi:hypothetical protein
MHLCPRGPNCATALVDIVVVSETEAHPRQRSQCQVEIGDPAHRIEECGELQGNKRVRVGRDQRIRQKVVVKVLTVTTITAMKIIDAAL